MGHTTYMTVGRTIFGFGPSMYTRMPKVRDDYFKMIDETAELSPGQKELAKRDALLPK